MSTMPPVFSPDGRYIFYVLQDYTKNKSTAFVSSTQSGTVITSISYDNINPGAISHDGSKIAFEAINQGAHYVVIGSFSPEGFAAEERPVGGSIREVAFSLDGTHRLYATTSDGKSVLIDYE